MGKNPTKTAEEEDGLLSHTESLKLIILVTMVAILYIVNRWILGSKGEDKHRDDPLNDINGNGPQGNRKQ